MKYKNNYLKILKNKQKQKDTDRGSTQGKREGDWASVQFMWFLNRGEVPICTMWLKLEFKKISFSSLTELKNKRTETGKS